MGVVRCREVVRLALFVAMALPGSAAIAKPKAVVELVPSADAVVPGEKVTLALVFRIEDGWHIYWADAGDAGKPPSVRWKLPDGFRTSPLAFPGPTRHKDGGGLVVTNILEGTPILTAVLQAPERIDTKSVRIGADVTWLVCKDVCAPESQSIELVLPVAPSPSAVKPANEAVFATVARTHPVQTDRATYMQVSASTSTSEVAPGGTFDLIVGLSVSEGIHVQSHEPTVEGLIGTDVFVNRPAGLNFGQAVYPRPAQRVDPVLGRLSENSGRVEVRFPVTVQPDFTGPSADISGVVLYQACNEKSGQCFPPQYVAWSTKVNVPGGKAAASAPAAQAAGDAGGVGGFLARLGLVGLLAGCFIYGLCLNATPCVFPLLSIKIVGFVQQAHESRRQTTLLGLTFGAGVMLFFVVLGFVAAAGKNVLQYPAAIIALGTVVTALALSMLGVYTLQVPTVATKIDAAIRREGLLSSFGKGALAPVLGFACTGPLLAGVFGWATQQPPRTAVLAFLAAGLGMAGPYMLLGANPRWLSFLPRPGPWMITFERVMGFLLLGMVIWLLSPLVQQIGPEGLEWTFAFLVAVAMACWLLGRIEVTMSPAQRWRYRAGAAAVAVAAGGVIYGWIQPLSAAEATNPTVLAGNDWPSGIPWQPWSDEAVEKAVRSGKTAFVDFTAAWCTVCKLNKKVATNTAEVRAKMESLGVVPFRADFTSYDARIAEALHRYGRNGPPLNLIYPAGKPDAPTVLSPNLTKDYLLEQLDKAERSSQKEGH
jgi:thiol:disulfide interchange protein DsbD